MLHKLKKALANPNTIKYRIIHILYKNHLISDKKFLELLFKMYMGYPLNLDNPKTFTEKIQWIKLYDRRPEYTIMADKIKAKDWVAKKIGKDHIIPTIAIWDNPEDIDFGSLPDKFVLKCNHNSGSGMVICKDKADIDQLEAIKGLRRGLNIDYSLASGEWSYKDIERKIFAEEFISNEKEGDLKDYKFFCFNGDPKFFKIDFGRFTDHHANYYDLDWNLLPYGEVDLEPIPDHQEMRPINFDKMVEIAKILSNGIPFLRVDLYNIEGKIYFGELTFYPGTGMHPWTLNETDYEIGNFIHLPIDNNTKI